MERRGGGRPLGATLKVRPRRRARQPIDEYYRLPMADCDLLFFAYSTEFLFRFVCPFLIGGNVATGGLNQNSRTYLYAVYVGSYNDTNTLNNRNTIYNVVSAPTSYVCLRFCFRFFRFIKAPPPTTPHCAPVIQRLAYKYRRTQRLQRTHALHSILNAYRFGRREKFPTNFRSQRFVRIVGHFRVYIRASFRQ